MPSKHEPLDSVITVFMHVATHFNTLEHGIQNGARTCQIMHSIMAYAVVSNGIVCHMGPSCEGGVNGIRMPARLHAVPSHAHS